MNTPRNFSVFFECDQPLVLQMPRVDVRFIDGKLSLVAEYKASLFDGYLAIKDLLVVKCNGPDMGFVAYARNTSDDLGAETYFVAGESLPVLKLDAVCFSIDNHLQIGLQIELGDLLFNETKRMLWTYIATKEQEAIRAFEDLFVGPADGR